MSFARQNSSAATDWAKKRQQQLERARKLREERLRQGGFDGEDPPASVGSSRPSSGSRRSSVHQASPSGYASAEHVNRRMQEIRQYETEQQSDKQSYNGDYGGIAMAYSALEVSETPETIDPSSFTRGSRSRERTSDSVSGSRRVQKESDRDSSAGGRGAGRSQKRPEWNNDFSSPSSTQMSVAVDDRPDSRESTNRGAASSSAAPTPSQRRQERASSASKPPLPAHSSSASLSGASSPSQKAQEVAQRRVDQSVPPEYICPLGRQVMLDPVVAEDGYAYERESIEAWLYQHGTSPITGAEFKYRVVFDCKNLKRLITKFNNDRLERMQGKSKPKWMAEWSSEEEDLSSQSRSARLSGRKATEQEGDEKRHRSGPESAPTGRGSQHYHEEDRGNGQRRGSRMSYDSYSSGDLPSTHRDTSSSPARRAGSASASSKLAALKARMGRGRTSADTERGIERDEELRAGSERDIRRADGSRVASQVGPRSLSSREGRRVDDEAVARPAPSSYAPPEEQIVGNVGGSLKEAIPAGLDVGDAEGPMGQCSICGRRFFESRLTKHENACEKAQKKRRAFDSSKNRAEGSDIGQFMRENGGALPSKGRGKGSEKKAVASKKADGRALDKKAKWKRQHEAFIANIRAARGVSQAIKEGKPVSEIPVVPSAVEDDLVQCPHCKRRFNEGAAERHIPRCQSIIAKPKMLRRGTGKAAGQLPR